MPNKSSKLFKPMWGWLLETAPNPHGYQEGFVSWDQKSNTQWFFEVFEINVTGSSLILDFFSNRVEQLVSEHLRVLRANASQMLLHCSKSSSCRAKSYTSKGAWIIKKSSRNEQVIHILVLGDQKHTKKILENAWASSYSRMSKRSMTHDQTLPLFTNIGCA